MNFTIVDRSDVDLTVNRGRCGSEFRQTHAERQRRDRPSRREFTQSIADCARKWGVRFRSAVFADARPLSTMIRRSTLSIAVAGIVDLSQIQTASRRAITQLPPLPKLEDNPPAPLAVRIARRIWRNSKAALRHLELKAPHR